MREEVGGWRKPVLLGIRQVFFFKKKSFPFLSGEMGEVSLKKVPESRDGERERKWTFVVSLEGGRSSQKEKKRRKKKQEVAPKHILGRSQ